jgi:protein-tyrosine phosphatase
MGEPGEALMTDLHSHLVPGVDDGARTLDDAMEGVQRMVDRGIANIVTTPHLLGSLTRDPHALAERLGRMDEAFVELAAAVAARHPGLRLERGHEVMLDVPDPELSDPRLRLAGTSFALVEWPRLQIPPETSSALRKIRDQGIDVVIAHAERYGGYDEPMTLAGRWKDEGAVLQVNYGALLGKYGPEARSRAVQLLERGWADCLATDFHGRPGLRLFVEGAHRVFEELGAEEAWWLLTRTNPDRISRGERPLPVPVVKGERRLLSKLFSLFRS